MIDIRARRKIRDGGIEITAPGIDIGGGDTGFASSGIDFVDDAVKTGRGADRRSRVTGRRRVPDPSVLEEN